MFRRAVPVGLIALLAACGASEPSAPAAAPVASAPAATSNSTSPATPADDSVPTSVPAALQFSAPLVGGGDIELGALAGRPVLLWFWAPW
ncbi:MAG: hypothetical protein ABIP17_06800 [Ilumatobacteraceae bacterium]